MALLVSLFGSEEPTAEQLFLRHAGTSCQQCHEAMAHWRQDWLCTAGRSLWDRWAEKLALSQRLS